jgi:hypothetical protein
VAPPSHPPPTFVARAADEWQGMPVEREDQPECDTAATCGLALACVAGHCGACTRDDQCLAGETCALDHCVRAELSACRGRRDCAADELCALSGVSADARGNGEMRARCLAPEGTIDEPPAPPVAGEPAPEGDYTDPARLLESL